MQASENQVYLSFYNERSQVSSTRSVVKGESSCKRVGGNSFTHATSAAEVQAHKVQLKVKAERLKRKAASKRAKAELA